ncbi:hypothetical protein FRB90_002452 [Tulasnella sp. 427]|nr:hypothetical protein FRB90_002452 [Tulasnella sp. 427]
MNQKSGLADSTQSILHTPWIQAELVMSDQITDAMNRITEILTNAVWPKRSASAVQRFVAIFENPANLYTIPSNNNVIAEADRTLLDDLIRVLGVVFQKLQEASDRYGAKERTFGKKIKYFFAYMDRDQCTAVLDGCRNDVENALMRLASSWEQTKQAEPFEQLSTAAEVGPVKLTTTTLTPVQTVGALPKPGPIPAPSSNQSTGSQIKPPEPNLKRRERLSTAKKTLTTIQAVAGTIPVVGSYIGAAAQVGLAVVSTLQSMDSNQEISKELESSTSRLVGLLEHLDKKTVQHQKEKMASYINAMIDQLKTIQDQVNMLNPANTLKRVVVTEGHTDTLKGYQESIKAALEEIQLLVSLNTANLLREIYDADVQKEHRRLLDRLGDANYGAKGDAIEDVICLPGTRTKILERIDEWIRDTKTSERVLWIRGTAGRGKSTIASTLAHRWRYRAACGIFHFRRGQNVLDQRLVCALARQLGRSAIPAVKESVLKSIKENEDIAQERLQEQFQTLFVGSLERLEDEAFPVLLIVDALDECESSESAVNFVRLIDRYLPSLPANVKFLLTSRPEAPLMRALEPRPWHAEDLDTRTDADEDIEQFLNFGLLKIKTEHQLGEAWPPPEALPSLVRMSQGLFQWADTAIQYMIEGSPQDRLEELLLSPSVCDGLDSLYLQILSKGFRKVAKSPLREDLFLRTLGVLVVSPYPISLDIMAFIFANHEALRNKSEESIIRLLRQEVLADITSLIYVPRQSASPVRLVHTSTKGDAGTCRAG